MGKRGGKEKLTLPPLKDTPPSSSSLGKILFPPRSLGHRTLPVKRAAAWKFQVPFFAFLQQKKSFPNMIIGGTPPACPFRHQVMLFLQLSIKGRGACPAQKSFPLVFPSSCTRKKYEIRKGGDIRVGVTVLRENIVTVTEIFAVGRLAV